MSIFIKPILKIDTVLIEEFSSGFVQSNGRKTSRWFKLMNAKPEAYLEGVASTSQLR